MRIFFFLSLILAASSVWASIDPQVLAQRQAAYYGADFSTRKINKEDLFNLISQHHVSVGYTTARKLLFGELHLQQDGNGSFVEDVYCHKKFHFRTVAEVSSMSNQVNIEHTWPQSKFTGKFNRDMQKSDLHHLYPTDSAANNKRANLSFGNVSEEEDQLNVHDCEISRLGNKSGRMVFFPPTEHRGNVARSLFYFSTRYQLPLSESEEAVLREWHKADPVDAFERDRHETVVKYQTVRNPFVDYPNLVNQISDF